MSKPFTVKTQLHTRRVKATYKAIYIAGRLRRSPSIICGNDKHPLLSFQLSRWFVGDAGMAAHLLAELVHQTAVYISSVTYKLHREGIHHSSHKYFYCF